jgi:hypothetical protein
MGALGSWASLRADRCNFVCVADWFTRIAVGRSDPNRCYERGWLEIELLRLATLPFD